MNRVVLLIFSIVMLSACKKNDVDPVAKNNEFVGTSWLRGDLAGEIVWGGKNYFKLNFIDNSKFEILNIKDDKVRSLYVEGAYAFSSNKRLTLKYTLNDVDYEMEYLLRDSRTLVRINSEGKESSSSYDNYIKQ